MSHKNLQTTLVIPPEIYEKLLEYCDKNNLYYTRNNELIPAINGAILGILKVNLGVK